MRRIGIVALALAIGPFATSSQAHVTDDGPGAVAAARALGPGATATKGGLFKVPLADGTVIRSHGPDVASPELVAASANDRFLSGATELAPICSTDYAVQVLYARTAATADHFASSVAGIRSTVRRSNEVLNEDAIASGGGGGKYKVFCDGGGEIDVKQFTTVGTDYSGVVNAAKAAGFTNSHRDYAIFLDEPGGGYCGVGSLYGDDRSSLANAHNQNGGYSVIYRGCWTGTTFMHEVGHNRGAVQEDAPHSTGSGGHCNEGNDVMCYAPDGGNRNQSMIYNCAATTFDCNFDDYFDAAPEPGEYLATHWNIGTQGQNFLTILPATPPPNTKPTAAFSAQCTYLECDFTDESTDSDGSIPSRSWSFGDGASSTATNPHHAFPSAGAFSVSLTVTDDDGATDTKTLSVDVLAEPEDPSDTAAPDTVITRGPKAKTRSRRVTFEFTGSDNASAPESLVFRCAVDNGAFQTCVSPSSYGGLGRGRHTFAVQAVDEAGNTDPTPASLSWRARR